jgi:hypothetical protein
MKWSRKEVKRRYAEDTQSYAEKNREKSMLTPLLFSLKLRVRSVLRRVTVFDQAKYVGI